MWYDAFCDFHPAKYTNCKHTTWTFGNMWPAEAEQKVWSPNHPKREPTVQIGFLSQWGVSQRSVLSYFRVRVSAGDHPEVNTTTLETNDRANSLGPALFPLLRLSLNLLLPSAALIPAALQKWKQLETRRHRAAALLLWCTTDKQG